MKIPRFVGYGIIAVGACLSLRAAGSERFLQTIPRGYDTVVFPADEADAAYADARSAIEIDAVLCDSVEVTPKYEFPASAPSQQVIRVNKWRPIYQLWFKSICTWDRLDRIEGLYRLKMYELPQTFTSLEIKYRVRSPGGSVSQPRVVLCVRSDDVLNVIVPPDSAQAQRAHPPRPTG